MKIQDVDKKELLVIFSMILSLVDKEEFKKEFPSVETWILENASQKEIDQVIEKMKSKIDKDPQISISKSDFMNLYAYGSAVIGFEEMNIQFHKMRSLLLNILSPEDMTSIMDQIRSVENALIMKYSNK